MIAGNLFGTRDVPHKCEIILKFGAKTSLLFRDRQFEETGKNNGDKMYHKLIVINYAARIIVYSAILLIDLSIMANEAPRRKCGSSH